MKAKKIVTLLMVPLLLLMVVGIASAGTKLTTGATLTWPATAATIQSLATNKLNCTVGGALSNVTLWNITYQARSTETGNSSWTTICQKTLVNFTDQAGSHDIKTNCTWNNARAANVGQNNAGGTTKRYGDLDDHTAYQFRVIVVNASKATETNTSATKTEIIVDYTTPTTPTSAAPSDGTVYDDGSVNVRINVTVSAEKTTNCTLKWEEKTPTGNAVDAMIHSGTTCYLSLTNVPDGSYKWAAYATDGTNSTGYTTYAGFTMDNNELSPTGMAYVVTGAGDESVDGFGGENGNVLAFLLIAGIIIYVLVNRNKR